MYIIGIDGGGTKTEALLYHMETGGITRRFAEGCNPHSTGFMASVHVVQRLIATLLEDSHLTLEDISSVAIGISGLGRAHDKAKWQRLLLSEYVKFKKTLLIIDNDAVIALYSGTYGRDGLVSINGTGSICYGIKGDVVQRSGGWGHLVDADPGSGYYIGYYGLNAIFRSYDGLGKTTELTEHILNYFGEKSVPNLIQHIYKRQDKVVIAQLAKVVLQTATHGDVVAQKIVQSASMGIVENSRVVYKRLYANNRLQKQIPLVLIGGMYQNDYLCHIVSDMVAKELPAVKITYPLLGPVYGAIVLALKGRNYVEENIEKILTQCIRTES